MENKGIQYHFSNIKWNAAKRGIDFYDNLTQDYIFRLYKKQKGTCPVSVFKIQFASSIKDHRRGGTTASLDRIDSLKGYSKDNVRWVHKDINRMLGKMEDEEFLTMCQAVVNTIGKG